METHLLKAREEGCWISQTNRSGRGQALACCRPGLAPLHSLRPLSRHIAYSLHLISSHPIPLQSQVLAELSSLGRLVVATGGGAVLRPMNWWGGREGGRGSDDEGVRMRE